MSDGQKLTATDDEVLADAFPAEFRSLALRAGNDVARRLRPDWPIQRFPVRLGGQPILIPERLYFTSELPALSTDEEAWLLARALQTRSCDGFERQRAVRDLFQGLKPWGAPFVADLIGQYVIEILEDVLAAMTPDIARMVAAFAAENPAYWIKIKQRVVSYWNAYYRLRSSNDREQAYRRDEYVGFILIDRIEKPDFGAS
jgi:hypothetical protein